MKSRAMIVSRHVCVGARGSLDVSRRRRRRSLCGPCCRWSSSRATRDGTVAVGVVEPRYKTDLALSPVLGRLTARPVYVGDLVSEGQTVGTIDSTALELAVRSAKAELAKAEAQLATARATEERQRTLITSDATTKQTLDNAEQARAGADASVAQRAGKPDQGH